MLSHAVPRPIVLSQDGTLCLKGKNHHFRHQVLAIIFTEALMHLPPPPLFFSHTRPRHDVPETATSSGTQLAGKQIHAEQAR